MVTLASGSSDQTELLLILVYHFVIDVFFGGFGARVSAGGEAIFFSILRKFSWKASGIRYCFPLKINWLRAD